MAVHVSQRAIVLLSVRRLTGATGVQSECYRELHIMWQLLRYIMLVGKGNIAWEDQEGDIRKVVGWRSLCRETFTRK